MPIVEDRGKEPRRSYAVTIILLVVLTLIFAAGIAPVVAPITVRSGRVSVSGLWGSEATMYANAPYRLTSQFFAASAEPGIHWDGDRSLPGCGWLTLRVGRLRWGFVRLP